MTPFEEIMLPHLDAAYNLARWLTGNETDAQDIVQEAYVRGLRYFGGFTGGDGKVWLLAIVRNTFLTWRKAQKSPVAFDEHIHSPGGGRDPEAAAVTRSQIRSLRGCVEALPVEYREALVMRELEGLSYQDIATAAALPLGTVMSRLSRARKRLADCMAAREKRA